MEINNIKLNFRAKSIYPLKIKKRIGNNYRLVKADFAELSPCSKVDKQCVEDLAENWQITNYPNNYISDIRNGYITDFTFPPQQSRYFITRLLNKKGKMSGKVATITSIKPMDDGKNLKIEFLQSAPKYPVFKSALFVKGGGELTMLGVVKLAKKLGYKNVKLVSTNDSFYAHLGLTHIIPLDPVKKPHDNITHFLPAYRYDTFIKTIEDKYKI